MTTSAQIKVQYQALLDLGGDATENISKYAEPWRQVINTNERFHRDTRKEELLAVVYRYQTIS